MLETLAYHNRVCDYFKGHTKTWDFFAASRNKEEQLAHYKTELLKNTYKFDPLAESALYEKVAVAKERLGLMNLEVTVYQAQYTDELNASIIYLRNEAHIVFSGQIIQLLDEAELQAVLAHELTHVKLYTQQQGQLEIADRIITAIANSPNSEVSHYETARLFRLYTEIYCDRGAYDVVGATGPVVTSLVKTATGLKSVNAESYIRQAEEIFTADAQTQTQQPTHPENFIRARAIHLWHEKKNEANADIIKMIEGRTVLDQLDIFKQQEMSRFTLTFLRLFLKPKWFQTVLVLSQARQYFSDYAGNESILLEDSFREKIETADISIKEYLSYVLLDFAWIDKALDDVPAGWAFQFAEDVGLKETFGSIVKKEMKLSDKKLQQYKQKALAAYYGVKEGEGEQIYEG